MRRVTDFLDAADVAAGEHAEAVIVDLRRGRVRWTRRRRKGGRGVGEAAAGRGDVQLRGTGMVSAPCWFLRQ